VTLVIGTAGHIDHGKTALLRALTGIDADRLPEERRRGMTIDVGYAWLDLEDGSSIDFVDVPGHDALIGNMLVGAGEIDAAMLVVAADDGIRAQTIEHLELLDALGIRDGLAVVTKSDVAGDVRATEVATQVRRLLDASSLAGAPVVVASAVTNAGLDDVRATILRVRDVVAAKAGVAAPDEPCRLAVDRAFAVRGRGAVATGTLRAGRLRAGDALRVEPGGFEVRVRGLEVRHDPTDVAEPGRTAVNVAGTGPVALGRGMVLTCGPGIVATDRLLAALARPMDPGPVRRRGSRPAWPPADGSVVRLHVGTAQVDATVGRLGREAATLPDGRAVGLLRLAAPVATFRGDRAVLRRPSPGDVVAGATVLDPQPAHGISRRRATPERLAALAVALDEGDPDAATEAMVALHGAHPSDRGLLLAADVREALERALLDLVAAHHAAEPASSGLPLAGARPGLRASLRRLATVRRDDAAAMDAAIDGLVEVLVARRRLARDRDRLRDPARSAGPPPELAAAMDRLEARLNVPAPDDLSAAARAAGCPPEGIRALEAAGRIVRVEADLAWAAPAHRQLAATALALARRGPLAPAALRDATGTSRRVVMPLLEDLGRRGILVRTPAGHVPGPRAPREPVPQP